jgi:hypothetical protein
MSPTLNSHVPLKKWLENISDRMYIKVAYMLPRWMKKEMFVKAIISKTPKVH